MSPAALIAATSLIIGLKVEVFSSTISLAI
jgi:hypothetical protein